MNASRPKASTISAVASMPADRTTLMAPTPLPRAPVGGKAVDRDGTGGRLSSAAGVVLRKDIDDPLGFTHDLAMALKDPRDPRRVVCTVEDLLKQRVYQSVAGDAEAHDAHTLRDAPICNLRLARWPETGDSLSSQPTLSRCEQRVSRTDLDRMARGLLEHGIASYAKPPQVSVLDVADTEDRGHGPQDQARYNGYEGGACCRPLHLYAGRSGRLMPTILQAKRFTGTQLLAVVQRLGQRRRPAWPPTLLLFRGDSHLASPEGLQWREDQPDLSSVTGWTSHASLQALAREVVEQPQRAYERRGHQLTRLHATCYQAGTGRRARRVVLQVEVRDQGVNTRCVVTAREQARTQGRSQPLYGARGPAENEIQAHHLSLPSDRTACHRFAATQLRFLWPAAASVFLATGRRDVLRATQGASATLETIP